MLRPPVVLTLSSKARRTRPGYRRSDGRGTPRPAGAGTIGPVEMGRDEFEDLVADVMDAIPEPFASAFDEVAVTVEERVPPGSRPLYGLYTGVPLTEGPLPSGMLPAHIAIYMHPLLDHHHDYESVAEQVRITVLHELAHHLGFGEERLEELGYG
jgi:predicted Zn-dependent protease with MMP-like domain